MFVRVLDKDKKWVSVEDAQNGVDYFCPHCGACMRVRKCLHKHSHFCLHQSKHLSPDCLIIEKEKDICRDVGITSVEGFFDTLSRALPNKKGGKKGGKKTTGSKVLPANGLRTLYGCGADKMDPQTPIQGGVLLDLLVTSKSYYHMFPEGNDLGFRALEVWLRGIFNYEFRYVAQWTYKGEKYCAFFNHAADEKLVWKLADHYFHTYKENWRGTPYWIHGKFNRVMIAGQWSHLDVKQCKGKCNQCKNGVLKDGTRCMGMWNSDMPNEKYLCASMHPDNRR